MCSVSTESIVQRRHVVIMLIMVIMAFMFSLTTIIKSKIEHFGKKKVNNIQQLTIFTKYFILDLQQDSEYVTRSSSRYHLNASLTQHLYALNAPSYTE